MEIMQWSSSPEFAAVSSEDLCAYLPPWSKVDPADHCMSEEDFILGGYKYSNGDIIYSKISGLLITIGADVCIEDMDWNDGCGHKRFILRAAALKTEHQQETEELKNNEDMYKKALEEACNQFGCTPSHLNKNINDLILINKKYAEALAKSAKCEISKPKRARVEYEKVKFSFAWQAVKAVENGEKLYTKVANGKYVRVTETHDSIRYLYELYRKLEVEVNERQEFIDAMIQERNKYNLEAGSIKGMFGSMFDSGKFKLVDDK